MPFKVSYQIVNVIIFLYLTVSLAFIVMISFLKLEIFALTLKNPAINRSFLAWIQKEYL